MLVRDSHPKKHIEAQQGEVYAALDLGTNNCRLLIAQAKNQSFEVIDSFSRVVRLGEGLAHQRQLSEKAMERTIEALRVCCNKMRHRKVSRSRLVATEACRYAENRYEFLRRVWLETGLNLEIISQETEARLAAEGCEALMDEQAHNAILFDIGGGSTEIIWLVREKELQHPIPSSFLHRQIKWWASIPWGVVTLAESMGAREHWSKAEFEAMKAKLLTYLEPIADSLEGVRSDPYFHLLGSSGTVTMLAGVFLKLERYDRSKVDGIWMRADEMDGIVHEMLELQYGERVGKKYPGFEKADLVIAGCAILEAIRAAFPLARIRVADRGLREGILLNMIRHP